MIAIFLNTGLLNLLHRTLLSAPRFSAAIPNAAGTLVAYTQTSYSFKTHSVTSELRVLDIASSRSTVVTDSFIGGPRWLGDSDELLWLKKEESGNTSFIIGHATRGQDKPFPYTAGVVTGAVSDLKITTLAPKQFGIVVSGKANVDGSLYNPVDSNKPLSTAKLYTSVPVRHWDEYIQPQKAALWYGVLQIQPLQTQRYVLSGLKNLLKQMDATRLECPIPPFGDSDNFDVSPNGIAFVTKDPLYNKATHTKCNLCYCSISSWSDPAPLEMKVIAPSGLYGALTSPVLSPVKNTLAFLAMKEDGYEADKNRIIIVYDLFGDVAEPIELFATADGSGAWDRSPASLTWSEDDSSLFITAEDSGRGVVFQFPVQNVSTATPEYLRKLTNSGYVTSVTPANKKLFLTNNSLVESNFYSVVDFSKSDNANKPTAPFRYLDGPCLGLSRTQVDELWWKGAEDHLIHAWVVLPSNFTPTKKYPLCYIVHGGPQGAWNDQWSVRWNAAVFAEQGYVVVAPNPTGSTGYGQAFTDGIRNSWGGRPYLDLVKGFEYIEEHVSYVDTSRAVAMGASYGGFMMNWIQGHELGRKFKALVTHDGIFSTKSLFATEELYFPVHDLGGPFWKVPYNWEQWDPSRFAENWQTPHLIIHSQLDYRLSMAEGLAAFNVLQMRGVESAFLTFPDENHWVLKPENSLVWHQTVLNWINKYVGLPPISGEGKH